MKYLYDIIFYHFKLLFEIRVTMHIPFSKYIFEITALGKSAFITINDWINYLHCADIVSDVLE